MVFNLCLMTLMRQKNTSGIFHHFLVKNLLGLTFIGSICTPILAKSNVISRSISFELLPVSYDQEHLINADEDM